MEGVEIEQDARAHALGIKISIKYKLAAESGGGKAPDRGVSDSIRVRYSKYILHDDRQQLDVVLFQKGGGGVGRKIF